MKFVWCYLLSAVAVELAVSAAISEKDVLKKTSVYHACLTSGCVQAASKIIKNVDASVGPCQNFYGFACGGFLRSVNIPSDRAFVSTHSLLEDRLRQRVKILIESPKSEMPETHKLLRHFYGTCLGKTAIERRGLKTIKEIINYLGDWPVVQGPEWDEKKFRWMLTVFRALQVGYNANYIVDVDVELNPTNSTQHVITIDQASLALNQQFLINGADHYIVKAYYNYMVEVAVIMGADRSLAEKELKESLDFEINLAKMMSASEKPYNPVPIKELETRYPSIAWMYYIISALGIDVNNEEVVDVKAPQYLQQLNEVLRHTPRRVLSNYIIWRIVESSVPFLTEDLRNRRLKLDSALTGITEKTHRSKECVEFVSRSMDLAVEALYARRHFNEDVRDKAKEITLEFRGILQLADWADNATREKALGKVDAITNYLDHYSSELYSDKELFDYYSKIQFKTNEYLTLMLKTALFKRVKSAERLRQAASKSDRTNRGSDAADSTLSEYITRFPVGMLQEGYLGGSRPNYLHFGDLGNVIGHEITKGLKHNHDRDRSLGGAWPERKTRPLTRRVHCEFAQRRGHADPQVNSIKHEEGFVASSVGIKATYLVYKVWVERNGTEPLLPGLNYTSNQMFWISAASNYCSKNRPEYLRSQVMINPSFSVEDRVNALFSNAESFAEDFHCPIGSNMNRKRDYKK